MSVTTGLLIAIVGSALIGLGIALIIPGSLALKASLCFLAGGAWGFFVAERIK